MFQFQDPLMAPLPSSGTRPHVFKEPGMRFLKTLCGLLTGIAVVAKSRGKDSHLENSWFSRNRYFHFSPIKFTNISQGVLPFDVSLFWFLFQGTDGPKHGAVADVNAFGLQRLENIHWLFLLLPFPFCASLRFR
jgi:hypothetical protein